MGTEEEEEGDEEEEGREGQGQGETEEGVVSDGVKEARTEGVGGTGGGAVVVMKPSKADRAIVIAHGLPRYPW